MSAQYPGTNVPTTPAVVSPSDSAAKSSPSRLNIPDGFGRGVFAADIQGSSPKYAKNLAERKDTQQRNTMARMFIRVDQSEQDLFRRSVSDPQVRENLLPRIAGDPTAQNSRNHRSLLNGNGYLDFILEQVQMPLQEKYQVVETLADNYVVYMFGQSPPIWPFSGKLINSQQDDQASNMMRLYLNLLRGTQLARRQKVVSITFDSYVVTGVLLNLVEAISSSNEILVPFSFQLLVKRIAFINTTRGWIPTVAEGAFTPDPRAISADGRPQVYRSQRNTVVQQPGQQVTPTPQNQADARTQQSAPPPNNGNGSANPGPVTASGGNVANGNGNQQVSSQPQPVDPALSSQAPGGDPETANASYPPNPSVSQTSSTQGG